MGCCSSNADKKPEQMSVNIPMEQKRKKSDRLTLGIVEYRELVVQLNHGYKQEYFIKKVRKQIQKMWQNKAHYTKDSQKLIDELVSTLLKKMEDLDRREDIKNTQRSNSMQHTAASRMERSKQRNITY
jgi:hypothetical protein